jgi:hypothetical protein
MAEKSSAHPRIDVAVLDYVEVTDAGARLRLHVTERSGRAASVSLPVACLNNVVSAAPRALDQPATTVHKLDSWSLSQGEAGLLLTLRLSDSSEISFSLASHQLLAMASVIPTAPGRLLH